MARDSSPHPLFQDPLSEATRRQRRTLLALSGASIAFVWAKLIPKGIPMLGIDLSGNPSIFPYLFLAALIYSGIMFVIYARSDLLLWNLRIQEVTIEREKERRDRQIVIKKLQRKAEKLHPSNEAEGFEKGSAQDEAKWIEEDSLIIRGLEDKNIAPILERSKKLSLARIVMEFYFPGIMALGAVLSLILAIYRNV
jgi:hypothetical protein